MKMVRGSGDITTYTSVVYNCTLGQYNYKIPGTPLVNSQMLYIDFGASAPGFVEAGLIWTCGPGAGTIEPLTLNNYVIGQDTNGNYYGVFDTFNEETAAPCYVILLAFDIGNWFSQEYCAITTAGFCASQSMFVKSCYGNLDPLISYDAEGIYFGQSQGGTQGNPSLVYQHQFKLNQGEITLNAIKNDFKQGRTRNFRTESTNLYLFWGELIPEWYIRHIDAVFKRGEVIVQPYYGIISTGEQVNSDFPETQKFLVDSTAYEKVDECIKGWKPSVNLRRSQYQSFSCEVDPCSFVQDGTGGTGAPCCDPIIIDANTVFSEGNTVTIDFTPCTPAPTNYSVIYRLAGSSSAYISAGDPFTSSPAVFAVSGDISNTDGDQYEGFIYSNCGGVLGNNIAWSTVGASPSPYSLEVILPCAAGYSPFIINGSTPGDSVVIRTTFSGNMARTGTSLFVRADLTVRSPYITDPPTFSPVPQSSDSSACFTDSIGHGFNVVIDVTIIIPAVGGATFDMFAIVNNSNPVIPKGVLVELISVNGSAVSGISQIGCAGDSATAGTC